MSRWRMWLQALNTDDEKARWKFVANRRNAAEWMLSEVTKKNVDIMGMFVDVEVMATVSTVGPYYPKLVKEFVCNMTTNIDDSTCPNFQK
ncbi:hypothetical protein LIER_10259 [Lithospermum erythrorhizon]|uniref:Uncharacterized protein n=1 Tax=Lithospermum erythrorhizon TaxID=34254 RepID=A0AAV3PK11_LITER